MSIKHSHIGVSQKAILCRNGVILAIRRSKTASARPLHWDLPGGDLNVGEDAQAGIVREIQEETGLHVRDVNVMDVQSGFNDIGEFWVTICYTAQPTSSDVVLSLEHDRYQWVLPDTFLKLLASPRNIAFVKKYIQRGITQPSSA